MPDSGDSAKKPAETQTAAITSFMSPAFVMSIIQLIGLPGLIILAWLGAILFDMYKAEHLMIWALLLGASAIYALVTFMKSNRTAAQDNLLNMRNEHIEQAKNLHKLAELSIEQLKINKEIYAVISSQLSVKHVMVLLPIFMEAFKWKLLATLMPAYDDLLKSRHGVDLSSYLHVSQMYLDSLMLPLVRQHVFFKDAFVEQTIRKCIDDLFMYIQSPEFRDLDDKVRQDRDIIQKINTMSVEVYTTLNDYLELTYDL